MKLISYLKILITLALLVFIGARIKKVPKITGINFMYVGYNPVLGNPHAKGMDPGIMNQYLFKVDPAVNENDSPPGLQVMDTPDMKVSENTKDITDAISYQKTLSEDAIVGGSLKAIAFTANESYKYVLTQSLEKKNFSQEQIGISNSISVGMQDDNPPKLEDTFVTALKGLPPYTAKNPKDISKINDSYCRFFAQYGTHCFSYITFGTRYVKYIKKSSSTTKKGTDHTFNVGGKVTSTPWTSITSGEVKGGYQAQHKDSATIANEHENFFSVGCTQVNTINDWKSMDKAKCQNVPVKYKVIPLNECLHAKNQLAETISENIGAALANYCKDCLLKDGIVTDCTAPVDLVTPKKFVELKDNVFYRLKNLANNMCFTGDTNEKTLIKLFECDLGKNSTQCWQSRHLNNVMVLQMKGTGNEKKNLLLQRNTGKVTFHIIEAKESKSFKGIHEQFLFNMDEIKDGYYISNKQAIEKHWYKKAKNFGIRCLTPEMLAKGAQIVITLCTNSDDQKWELEPC